MPLTLLLGGARSGKSALAVTIGERHRGGVVFVATAEAFDADMATRIERHRTERPPWATIEAPIDLAGAVAAAADDVLVIVDCLTVWLGNLHVTAPPRRRAELIDEAVAALAARRGSTLVVSNEVGMGVVPDNEVGREYRDELGRLNQRVAALADTTLLVVAGRALRLDAPSIAFPGHAGRPRPLLRWRPVARLRDRLHR